MPMIPQATRPPAFPVLGESGWSVFPRSSSPAWMTRAERKMHWEPLVIEAFRSRISVRFDLPGEGEKEEKYIKNYSLLPIILLAPNKEMTESEKAVLQTPLSSATIFPKSPTCLIWDSRAPCGTLSGL